MVVVMNGFEKFQVKESWNFLDFSESQYDANYPSPTFKGQEQNESQFVERAF